MNIIQKALNKKLHISQKTEVNQQSWEEFYEKTISKKIIMFGVGACADFVLENHKDISFEGVIDNDYRKQGFYLEDFVEEAKKMECGKLKIAAIEMLKQFSANSIAILITSTNYYEQIMQQLEKMGINNFYIALIMEANARKDMSENELRLIEEKQSPESYAQICCREEINYKKIFFYSFGTYSDHGKYITEAILRTRADLDIVWMVNNLHTQVPKGVRKIYAGNWKRCTYEMETARIWVYNMVVPNYIQKRAQQIYIQTKHWASITLKRFYLDSLTIQDVSENVANWRYNSQIMDYVITGSDFDSESSRRGFGFQKEVLQIGSPRSDALFCSNKYKNKINDFYHIETSMRILLYAPTYRFDKSSRVHLHEMRGIDLDFELTKKSLEQRFGGKWYILLRLHPSVAKESSKIEKPEYVIDASNYEDSEELAAACDIMISDYSSIMFEPAFVKKPVFLFATDRKDYIDKEYDLLIDYDTLPFPIAETNEELASCILNFDQEKYEMELDAFMEKYDVHEDGHASERAAEFISKQIDKEW